MTPPDLFATNALALGDISTEKDSDGALRRVKEFQFNTAGIRSSKPPAAELGIDLDNARIEPGKIILPQTGSTNVVTVPVDARE